MPRLFRFVAVLLLSLTLAAPACAKPLLWAVRQGNTTIYLFGTVHLLPSDTDWMSDKLSAALDRSQRLSIELIDDDPATVIPLVRKYGRDPAHPLSSKLRASDRAKLKLAVATANLPGGEEALEPMRPWLAALTLTVAPLVQAGMDPNQGVDKQLKARMIAAGKPVDGLETAEQQLRILADMPEPLQLDMLRETFHDVEEGPKKLLELVDAWKNGNTQAIARIESVELQKTSPELYKSLIVDRNKAWARTIAERLRNSTGGTSFIAVGAGHLAGPDSVQRQLEAMGFKVAVE
ncbi:MAG TPA: TraB/GumN family protein [Dyella sp.]|uniref:TraB/GumN family protein n=1 Tax=Dyella sp. TaxID=1869338 RepID=UPI002F927482